MPGDSKTEKATPKKRRDERKEGHVPLSKDIVTVVSLLGVFVLIKMMFPMMYDTLQRFIVRYVSMSVQITDVEGQGGIILTDMLMAVAKTCLPILLATIALAIVSTGAQTKFIFTSKNLAPKFSRLNPLKGIKNMVSLKSLTELLKNILKITILFIILYKIIEGDLNHVVRTMHMDIRVSSAYVLSSVMSMVIKISIVFVAISGFDLVYQIWDYERQIKMSKQELKEEYKQMEGNPEIKGRIRDIQRERARSRMMQAVPQADVIIRNPTHYAVALKYDIEHDRAPVLVAKGQDALALRIIKIGQEHQVHVIENKPLARGIYASTKVGTEIPEEYYGMVAEILVYIYRLNNKTVK